MRGNIRDSKDAPTQADNFPIFRSCLLSKMRLSVVLEGRYTGYEKLSTLVERLFFQALDNYWSENIRYWAEKLKLVNEKYMAALWEIQAVSASNGIQNLQSHIVSLPNDLDLIIKEMKNSVLNSNRFSCQKKRNLEEPLDLSVKK